MFCNEIFTHKKTRPHQSGFFKKSTPVTFLIYQQVLRMFL